MKDPNSNSNYFLGSKYFYHRLFVEIASESDCDLTQYVEPFMFPYLPTVQA